MKMYRATIELIIDDFVAADREDANEIVNAYVTELAKTGGKLSWTECDWDVSHIDLTD